MIVRRNHINVTLTPSETSRAALCLTLHTKIKVFLEFTFVHGFYAQARF